MWEKMPGWCPSAPDPSWGKKKGGLVVGDSGSERIRNQGVLRAAIKGYNPETKTASWERGENVGMVET